MNRKPPRHIEDDHQKALFEWAGLASFRIPGLKNLFAIPNGGKRNPREAARLKAQGVRAGVPDIFLAYPKAGHSGLFIELKRPIVKGEAKPTVSDEQKLWLLRMTEAGYKTAVCYGWHEAREQILTYMGD